MAHLDKDYFAAPPSESATKKSSAQPAAAATKLDVASRSISTASSVNSNGSSAGGQVDGSPPSGATTPTPDSRPRAMSNPFLNLYDLEREPTAGMATPTSPASQDMREVETIYEHQRWRPGKGYSSKLSSSDPLKYMRADGESSASFSALVPDLPEGYGWLTDGWRLIHKGPLNDAAGWSYAPSFAAFATGKGVRPSGGSKIYVRRRQWTRALGYKRATGSGDDTAAESDDRGGEEELGRRSSWDDNSEAQAKLLSLGHSIQILEEEMAAQQQAADNLTDDAKATLSAAISAKTVRRKALEKRRAAEASRKNQDDISYEALEALEEDIREVSDEIVELKKERYLRGDGIKIVGDGANLLVSGISIEHAAGQFILHTSPPEGFKEEERMPRVMLEMCGQPKSAGASSTSSASKVKDPGFEVGVFVQRIYMRGDKGTAVPTLTIHRAHIRAEVRVSAWLRYGVKPKSSARRRNLKRWFADRFSIELRSFKCSHISHTLASTVMKLMHKTIKNAILSAIPPELGELLAALRRPVSVTGEFHTYTNFDSRRLALPLASDATLLESMGWPPDGAERFVACQEASFLIKHAPLRTAADIVAVVKRALKADGKTPGTWARLVRHWRQLSVHWARLAGYDPDECDFCAAFALGRVLCRTPVPLKVALQSVDMEIDVDAVCETFWAFRERTHLEYLATIATSRSRGKDLAGAARAKALRGIHKSRDDALQDLANLKTFIHGASAGIRVSVAGGEEGKFAIGLDGFSAELPWPSGVAMGWNTMEVCYPTVMPFRALVHGCGAEGGDPSEDTIKVDILDQTRPGPLRCFTEFVWPAFSADADGSRGPGTTDGFSTVGSETGFSTVEDLGFDEESADGGEGGGEAEEPLARIRATGANYSLQIEPFVPKDGEAARPAFMRVRCGANGGMRFEGDRDLVKAKMEADKVDATGKTDGIFQALLRFLENDGTHWAMPGVLPSTRTAASRLLRFLTEWYVTESFSLEASLVASVENSPDGHIRVACRPLADKLLADATAVQVKTDIDSWFIDGIKDILAGRRSDYDVEEEDAGDGERPRRMSIVRSMFDGVVPPRAQASEPPASPKRAERG